MTTYKTFEMVLGVIVLIIMVLGYVARRRPHVRWLQGFDVGKNLTDAQRQRLRRSQNVTAGVELIVLGIGVFMAYFALQLAFFTTPTPLELALVGGFCLLCVVLGITALIRRGR